jgi:hypothetical protein
VKLGFSGALNTCYLGQCSVAAVNYGRELIHRWCEGKIRISLIAKAALSGQPTCSISQAVTRMRKDIKRVRFRLFREKSASFRPVYGSNSIQHFGLCLRRNADVMTA